MKAPVTKLVLLLDESISMRACISAMVSGFERLRSVLLHMEDEVTVDLWFFGKAPRLAAVDLKPSQLKSLNLDVSKKQSYHSTRESDATTFDYYAVGSDQLGSTALNFCLGDAIDERLRRGLEMEAAVVLVLMTDGENMRMDNHKGIASHDACAAIYGNDVLARRVEALRDSGQWTFVGFRPRGSRFALPGFDPSETADFENTAYGAAEAWQSLSDRIGNYLDTRQGGKVPSHLL